MGMSNHERISTRAHRMAGDGGPLVGDPIDDGRLDTTLPWERDHAAHNDLPATGPTARCGLRRRAVRT